MSAYCSGGEVMFRGPTPQTLFTVVPKVPNVARELSARDDWMKAALLGVGAILALWNRRCAR